MQTFFYTATGDATYLWRALQFQRFVAAHAILHNPAKMRVVTPSPYQFWIRSYESAISQFADLTAFADDPARASMPLFELGL
jgi:hypothetical protein